MSNINVKSLIDCLEKRIKEYRNECLNLSQAKMVVAKCKNDEENVDNGDFNDEDRLRVKSKLDVALSDELIAIESVSLALVNIKHAAYRLGRTRSTSAPEP